MLVTVRGVKSILFERERERYRERTLLKCIGRFEEIHADLNNESSY